MNRQTNIVEMSDFATLSLFIEEDNLVPGVQQVLKEIRPSWSNNIKFKVRKFDFFSLKTDKEKIIVLKV